MAPKKEKKNLEKGEKELDKREKELDKREKELEKKEETGAKSPQKKTKKLSIKEKGELIDKIKKKYIEEDFYCVAERKKGVKVTSILEVDIGKFPYRIVGECKSCKKPISKFISSVI
tara:strand:+ start:177 stop:527 length:351 start_codon:yes stop_codon:yes gene_type:complete